MVFAFVLQLHERCASLEYYYGVNSWAGDDLVYLVCEVNGQKVATT